MDLEVITFLLIKLSQRKSITDTMKPHCPLYELLETYPETKLNIY